MVSNPSSLQGAAEVLRGAQGLVARRAIVRRWSEDNGERSSPDGLPRLRVLAGADAGGEILAEATTILESVKLSGHAPEAFLADILVRIGDHKINRLDELLPWNWVPLDQGAKAVA